MIRSFADKRTAAIFADVPIKGVPADVRRRARVKLQLIHGAAALDDLRVPPGNRLEALSRDRAGRHSIRVNNQWRVCFVWRDGNAYEVQFTDYHSG